MKRQVPVLFSTEIGENIEYSRITEVLTRTDTPVKLRSEFSCRLFSDFVGQ